MPGHVKRGGTGEPDPDPSPFLFVSWEDKQTDMAKVKSQNLYEYTICVSYVANLSTYIDLNLSLTNNITLVSH